MNQENECCCAREDGLPFYSYAINGDWKFNVKKPPKKSNIVPAHSRYFLLLIAYPEPNARGKAVWLRPMRHPRFDGVSTRIHYEEGTFDALWPVWQAYARML